MNKLFSKIGRLIEKSPFKVLLSSLLVFVILITGAIKVNMATGNETLVKTTSDAYISNHNMEKDFGGDAMMVLLNGDHNDLLSQENVEKLWKVEERLKYEDGIHSLISPASVVHQITDKQAREIKAKIPEISDGLGEMSGKLIEIGEELSSKTLPNPEEIEQKLDDLMGNMDPDLIIADMLKQQEKEMADMDDQVATMSSGLITMGDQLITVGTELGDKKLPNPEELEKKLDELMGNLDPNSVMEEMLKEQEAEMAKMNDQVATMSGGLGTMGDQLIGIGTKLANQDMPNAEGIQEKLDELMATMNTDSMTKELDKLKGNLIADMDLEISSLSGGLGAMGDQLIGMGSELAGKEVPNPKEIAEKLNRLMDTMNPEVLMGEMLEEQELALSEMDGKVSEMSSQLSEMGNGLLEIGTKLETMDFKDTGALEEQINEIAAISKEFDDLITGQTELEIGIENLKNGLSDSSKGLDLIVDQLEEMTQQLEDTELKEKLSTTSKNIANSSLGLGKLSGQTKDLKIIAENSSLGLANIKLSLETELKNLKDNLPENASPDQLAELSTRLREMGNGLLGLSKTILDMPKELAGSLGEGPSKAIAEMKTNMEKEIADMKLSLSSGLDPEELEAMAGGLTKMGENLKEMSKGISNLPEKMGDVLSESLDPQTLLAGMMSDVERGVEDMKAGLSGGIDPTELKTMAAGFITMGENLKEMSRGMSDLPDKMGQALSGSMDPATLFSGMMSDIESEVAGMKSGLSGGIDPKELKTMADGFITMGKNLKEMGGGIASLPEKMGEALTGSLDPSVLFAGMMADIETEVEDMKASLSGGIDPDELSTMASGFVTMGENLKDLSEGLETFYEKSGMLVAHIPHNQKELDNIWYEEDGNLRDVFSDTIIDDEHMMMMIKLKGNIDDADKDALFLKVSDAMTEEYGEGGDINYVVSGKPVLDSSLRQEMKSNMQVMVVLAVLIMLAILFFVFNVRWKILSIGVILISVIATLGLMGHISVSMTMVSMAVFPILIGLGIDYSIQFHNRYEEERSVTKALSQIGKAVAVAVFATMLGFISLYASPVPMIKDFGKMLTIGVVVSFVGSIFLLMPILHIRDSVNPKPQGLNDHKVQDQGFISRLLGKTAQFVTKFAPWVLILAIALAGMGLIVDSKVGVETDIETFMPQDMDALGDIRTVRDVVGSTDQMVIYMKDEDVLSETNLSWIQDKVEAIKGEFKEQVEDVKSIDNLVSNFSTEEKLTHAEYMDVVQEIPLNQRSMFVNEEGTKGAVIINIKHMATEELKIFVEDINSSIKDAPMEVSVTGKSVLDVEMVKGLTDGRVKMTILGIGLVFLALLLVYRNAVKALIPVLPIILIVGMSGGIMYLLGLKYTPITATLGALILGMGTEMTIMLLERYMEERNNNKSKAEAMAITVKRIGKATLASGLTTIGGFSVLMLSNFVILKDFGLMTVINVSLALVSTFVILPAVIWIFDGFIIKEEKNSLRKRSV